MPDHGCERHILTLPITLTKQTFAIARFQSYSARKTPPARAAATADTAPPRRGAAFNSLDDADAAVDDAVAFAVDVLESLLDTSAVKLESDT